MDETQQSYNEMTGKELNEARQLLGFSQQELADAINMSRVMVGLMERDEKPIEMRTELAVWCLLYEARGAEIGDRAT